MSRRSGIAFDCRSTTRASPDPGLVELVVQVLGRVRGRTRPPRAAGRDELESPARRAVAAHLEGKELIKTVVVPGRLVNFVVR